MKAKSLGILAAAALLAASCGKKEEAAPAASRARPVKPVASKHRPAFAEPAERDLPTLPAPDGSGPGFAMQSSGPHAGSAAAEPSAPSQASPVPVAPARPPMTTEEANAWRESRRSEQRAERVTRAAEQMTARFKERDANGDGLLEQGELSGRMQRGFSRADTNGDGTLDASEQEAMIQNFAERAGDGGERRGGRRGPGGWR